MKVRTRYLTVELHDRGVRERLAFAGDRLRTDVTAYMRSAADDIGTAGESLRARCLRVAARVNAALAAGSNRIAPRDQEPGDQYASISANVSKAAPETP